MSAPSSRSLRVIQSSATIKKTVATFFSSLLIGPSARISLSINFLPLNGVVEGKGNNIQHSSAQQTSRNINDSGKAKIIQAPNETGGASGYSCPNCVTNTPLGGVPMMVASPPMEEA